MLLTVSAFDSPGAQASRIRSALKRPTAVTAAAADSTCATIRISSSTATILRTPTRKIGSLSETIRRIASGPFSGSVCKAALASWLAIGLSPLFRSGVYASLAGDVVFVNDGADLNPVTQRRAAHYPARAFHMHVLRGAQRLSPACRSKTEWWSPPGTPSPQCINTPPAEMSWVTPSSALSLECTATGSWRGKRTAHRNRSFDWLFTPLRIAAISGVEKLPKFPLRESSA